MLLFVAAQAREFRGLLPFCSRVTRLAWQVGWARGAELRGIPIALVANGVGAAAAAHAVDIAHASGPLRGVVSTGYCGALDPALEIGDIFVATAIRAGDTVLPLNAPQSVRTHAAGLLVSMDHIAQTVEEKCNLRARGASVIEMEAAGVAERAKSYDLPLFCVKSVTDRAGEGFVLDFNAALRGDGHFATMPILRSLIRRPAMGSSELVRLRNRCMTASRTLGEFLADCRF